MKMTKTSSPGSGLLRHLTPALAVALSLGYVHANMEIGQNLDAPRYWSPAPTWANAMKESAPWWTAPSAGGFFDTKAANQIPRQKYNGYPTEIPYTVMVDLDGNGTLEAVPHYVHSRVPVHENGSYKFTVVGKGQLRINHPGASWFTVDLTGGTKTLYLEVVGANDVSQFTEPGGALRASPSHISFEIRVSNVTDPVRDIRIMRPGLHTAGRDAFHPSFKEMLAPYRILRFMNWQSTNGSEVTTINRDTNRKDYYTQTTKDGVAIDHIIDLANELQKDIWICVPHKLENSHGLAYQIKGTLKLGLTCYVEYSNEVWNTAAGFPQNGWVNENTEGANLPQKYGTRADKVFRTFRTQFSNRPNDLVCVLAGQNANVWQLNQALITGGALADVIAVAPYFGTVFKDEDILAVKIKQNWEVKTSTSGYYGANYLDDLNEKTKADGTPLVKEVVFRPVLPVTGEYRVEIRHPAASTHAAVVPVTIHHDSGKTTVNVDQRTNGGVWRSLGTYAFNSGTFHDVSISTKGTVGRVLADAFRFVPVGGGNAVIVDNANSEVLIPTLDELANTATWAHLPTEGLKRHRDLSISSGKPLVAYEGGQHFVGARGTDVYPELTQQLLRFNRDWRMRNLYRNTYLNAVNNSGLTLFMHFVSLSRWEKYGSWGSMEYYKQPITTSGAVKEWAIRDWMSANPPTP